MDPRLLLVPSTLLGPTTWASTARALEGLGHRVSVPSMQAVADAAPPYWPAGVDSIRAAAADDPVILVPHSNSGLYVPAVVDALGDQVRGVIFVDAALPDEGATTQRDLLNGLVDPDGRLPPWTSWWDEADVAALFPDDEIRAQVEAEQKRMPLAYYDNLPPLLGSWDGPPRAYVWFGEPYGEYAGRAAADGWTTRHIAGNHLHMLVDPAAVAAALLEIAEGWQ